MSSQYARNILFTGAGFTHNFGSPLAEEMWYKIFNYPKIQENKTIRHLLLNNYNYEDVYSSIMYGNYNESEKAIIKESILTAYEDIYQIVLDFVSNAESPYPIDRHKVNELISRFKEDNVEGYFFTINQDLFVERHYWHISKNIRIPGIKTPPNFTWNDPLLKSKGNNVILRQVPSESELDKIKSEFHQHNSYNYIKLHGSHNWTSSSNDQVIVLGSSKEKYIKKEPILSWYFEIFQNVLFRENNNLLVLGYGFKDEHINKIFAQAIRGHNLKIYIFSPDSIQDIKSVLNKQRHGKDIIEGISGHFKYKLLDMFPLNHTTHVYKELCKIIFNINIR